jgi:hypothetical protein
MDFSLVGPVALTCVAIGWYCRRSKAPMPWRAVVVLLISAAGVSAAVVGPDAIRLAAKGFTAFRERQTIDPHRRGIVYVAGRSVVLPAPPGFVIVGSELPEVLKDMQADIPDNLQRVAMLVSDEAHARLVKGEDVILERSLAVDVSRKVQKRLGPEDFAQIKQVTREMVVELDTAKSPEEVFAKMEKEAGRSISDRQRAAMTDGFRLPFHRDTERIFAFSAFKEDNDGTMVALTTSSVLVGDVMIVLRVAGSKEDLEWTRKIADWWADAILAANARWWQ